MQLSVAVAVAVYLLGVLLAESVGPVTPAGLWFGAALIVSGLSLGYALGLTNARRWAVHDR